MDSGRKPTFLLEASGRTMGARRPVAVSRKPSVLSVAMFVDVEKIRAIAERVAKSQGMKWVEVEMKGGRSNPLLRIYVDKPEGVSHADCQNVSEQMSAILDVEDPFPGPYVLEVSSPGLDRKLEKPSDFEHFAGRRARLVLREPLAEQKVFEGRLAGFEAGHVRLRMDEGELRELKLSNISKARLVVEL
jgi:ribosome maturation factor RimP